MVRTTDTLHESLDALAAAEPGFARVIELHGRPEPRVSERGYETLLRTIVGQQVSVAVESLELSGQTVSGGFDLSHASPRTALLLTDSNGTQTRIELGAQSAGKVPFTIDPAKHGLRDGKYSVSIESENGEFPQVEVAGQVANVRVSAEGPVLQVKGVGSVPFYNILEFAQADAGLLGG